MVKVIRTLAIWIKGSNFFYLFPLMKRSSSCLLHFVHCRWYSGDYGGQNYGSVLTADGSVIFVFRGSQDDADFVIDLMSQLLVTPANASYAQDLFGGDGPNVPVGFITPFKVWMVVRMDLITCMDRNQDDDILNYCY